VSHALPATLRTPARRVMRALPALLLPLVAASHLMVGGCSKSTEAGLGSDEALPDPVAEGVQTPEEANQAAEKSINEANAEAELQKLEQEIGGG
jgi:hypothetical protein